ncbi:MAG TPA: hypothetical protein VKQ30_23835 [Ktedonobacterales bacterium]|nr:hypothetical protein [Ktedonobacterales bacterium]
MSNGEHDNGWETFDFDEWGVDGSGGMARNGHPTEDRETTAATARQPEGQWISQGGVLHWEIPGDEDESRRDLRSEAASVWAKDEVDLPPGVPDDARIRAARAWLARQRQFESEELGTLLLERRESGADEDATPEGEGPFDLALAEHQAAIETYERTLEALADLAAHAGPSRVLVEFYLWLNERLAMLAAMPEAPAQFAARLLLIPVEDEENTPAAPKDVPTPRSTAQWQGCAEALLRARRRVEHVSAPEPED